MEERNKLDEILTRELLLEKPEDKEKEQQKFLNEMFRKELELRRLRQEDFYKKREERLNDFKQHGFIEKSPQKNQQKNPREISEEKQNNSEKENISKFDLFEGNKKMKTESNYSSNNFSFAGDADYRFLAERNYNAGKETPVIQGYDRSHGYEDSEDGSEGKKNFFDEEKAENNKDEINDDMSEIMFNSLIEEEKMKPKEKEEGKEKSKKEVEKGELKLGGRQMSFGKPEKENTPKKANNETEVNQSKNSPKPDIPFLNFSKMTQKSKNSNSMINSKNSQINNSSLNNTKYFMESTIMNSASNTDRNMIAEFKKNLKLIASYNKYEFKKSAKVFLERLKKRGIQFAPLWILENREKKKATLKEIEEIKDYKDKIKQLKLPLNHKLYLLAIRDFKQVLLSFILLHGIPIYISAIVQFFYKDHSNLGILRSLLTLIITPFAFVTQSDLFKILNNIIKPVMLISVVAMLLYKLEFFQRGLKYYGIKNSLQDVNENYDKEYGEDTSFEFLKTLRIKNTGFVNKDQLEELVIKILKRGEEETFQEFYGDRRKLDKTNILGDSKKFDCMIIHDCLEIDKFWDELVEKELLMLEMRLTGLKAEINIEGNQEEENQAPANETKRERKRRRKRQKKKRKEKKRLKKLIGMTKSKKYEKFAKRRELLRKEIKICKVNLSGSPEILASDYCLVKFATFYLSKKFLQLTSDPKIIEEFKLKNIQIDFAPHPYDIDWNYYARRYKCGTQLKYYLICFFTFVVLPSITFFVAYTFPQYLANLFFSTTKTKTAAQIVADKKLLFLSIRVILSAIYSGIINNRIDKYFESRHFKTYTERKKTKFFFFNIYFLLNQIIADFYGIIIVGIKGLGRSKSEETLIEYHDYLFMAAFKVSFSLIASPYIEKLMNHLDKFWRSVKIFLQKYKIRIFTVTIIDKIKRDLPVEHSIPEMASFLVQCLFFILFFESFMIPFLNIFLLIALVIFGFLDQYLLLRHHSMSKCVNLDMILTVYKTAIVGTVILQVLNFSNSDFILQFLNFFSFSDLNSGDRVSVTSVFVVFFNLFFNFFKNISKLKSTGTRFVTILIGSGGFGVLIIVMLVVMSKKYGVKKIYKDLMDLLVEREIEHEMQELRMILSESSKRKRLSQIDIDYINDMDLPKTVHIFANRRVKRNWTFLKKNLHLLIGRRDELNFEDILAQRRERLEKVKGDLDEGKHEVKKKNVYRKKNPVELVKKGEYDIDNVLVSFE